MTHTGVVADPGNYTTSKLKSIQIAGTDFSQVSLQVRDVSFTTFFVGDSGLQLRIDDPARAFQNLTELFLDDYPLGDYDPHGSFDCTNCSIAHVSPRATEYAVYAVRWNNIYGDCPSRDAVAQIVANGTGVYDLGGNPLFCNERGDDAFDCTYVRVAGADGGVYTFETADYVNRLPVELMGGELQVLVDGAPAECALQSAGRTRFTARCDRAAAAARVQVAFRGRVVSAAAAGKRYDFGPVPPPYNASSTYKVTLEIVEMSRCPQCHSMINYTIVPFYRDYPRLAGKVYPYYLSLIKPVRAMATNGIMMHGVIEAYEDTLRLCFQDYAGPGPLIDLLQCLIDSGFKNRANLQCLVQLGEFDRARACARDRGYELSLHHLARATELGEDHSPALYVDGVKLTSSWDKGGESLARALCTQTTLRDDPDCADFQ